ncbi:hypothetical protein ACN20G_30645 (plasmid) [Streptomyces sp. BI20]|uniref:hypothetical protein n=1 Tax=Streptomyces sp. BI20 TaxID=3403460 RepID=UPI003C7671A1
MRRPRSRSRSLPRSLPRHLSLPALAVGAALVLGAVTPALSHDADPTDPVLHNRLAGYADGRSAKAAVFPTAPAWVPDAATRVRVLAREEGPAVLLRFDLPAHATLPTACSVVTPTGASAPDPTRTPTPAGPAIGAGAAAWWPVEMAEHTSHECGGWRVTVKGRTHYAWHPSPSAP